MTTGRLVRRLAGLSRGLALAATGALMLALMGCGGDFWDTEQKHDVTIVLNVSNLDGDPIGGATVWVDGVAQDLKTAWEVVYLGEGFPESWAGFAANWIRSGFEAYTYSNDDVDTIKVQVSKSGYYTQETEFDITGDLPDEVFAKDTFILEPWLAGASAQEQDRIVHKTKPGLVTGEAPKGTAPFTQYGAK